jgi:SAM-dependent methyltransferase
MKAPAIEPALCEFLRRWERSGAAERANYQLFLTELCDVLEVPRPDPAGPDDNQNAYVFERGVAFENGDGTTSPGRMDLYRRGCFVLEAKQGSDRAEGVPLDGIQRKLRRGTATRGTKGWDDAMLAARGQAELYARALPPSEGWPPFLLVVDVGYTIELYADFTRSGRTYIPFPDPRTHRLLLRDLERDETRERLRTIWADPLALDPSRRSARVTREVAAQLAVLAKSLEESGHAPETVAQFLMRCIFTMFAEDVKLIPEGGFTDLLHYISEEGVELFPDLVQSLWETMATGGLSPVLRKRLLQFNGGLFEDCRALPLSRQQLFLLSQATRADWRDVEPAIFGTLLERALDPVERQKLGAHYTPRGYVERLVLPTVLDPLRDDWEAVRVAAVTLANEGKLEAAAEQVADFHRRLCSVRVLDPACGSGNFLYVALEHLKRLEGEVLNILNSFGQTRLDLEARGLTVDPHQLLGLEINPRAAAITDLVLWIGYLQWHFRTRGDALPEEPVIRKFHNIECRDAVLEYDGVEEVRDEHGRAVTVWDRRTLKKHPITGEDVPDETARVPLLRYVNPRQAEWPAADFVVGNPPFIGNWRMRTALGDGYAETLRQLYPEVPESSDYVMYWWDHAARLARAGYLRRFGLISTNSLAQTFNRRVVQPHLTASTPLSLLYAISDHPWVDSADGAAVRIAMTVGEGGDHPGTLQRVVEEAPGDGEGREVRLATRVGKLFADLRIGADVAGAAPLLANSRLSCPGVKLHGSGFIVTPEEAAQLGLGRLPGLEQHVRLYRNGRDVTAVPRNVMVIDLFGLSAEEVRTRFPEVYQWVLERVKPERDQNSRSSYREAWWVFGEPRKEFRPALANLRRYISTVETSKHRFFLFLDASILPDNKLINIALDDAYFLGVLSSRIHVAWALAAGSRLGVGNDPVYVKTNCFEKFPLPDCPEGQQARIRELGEALDAHRKRQQAEHPTLTLTDTYNVLEKLRVGEPLTEKEKTVNEQGLVSVLKQLHDDLDRAVFDAYGWPDTLSDEEILERLVVLNQERAAEERRGLVRWVRPEFQNPEGAGQTALDTQVEQPPAAGVAASERMPWPKALPEQARAVRHALALQGRVVSAEELARSFKGARVDRVGALLETLASLGQAREVEAGRYTA